MRTRTSFVLAVVVALAIGGAAAVMARQAATPDARVDTIMARWTDTSPGCAVGVSVKDAMALERAYGMADLEHGVRNTPTTIFEAGSVSKQFTAAAVLLLARDGKLSLDDPVRKYLPELPDYGSPLTIRHMLNHTSGLRDWGNVASIAGWPRTTRVHTHAHVLDLASRQKSLNFVPGTRWSYSNTGYNLAAIIVSRVSGQSFADFTRDRIFTPMGMTRTSWRDDYTRIVKDRAIAYSEDRGSLAMDMPFENVHGNGGLLTTVGDLLRWTRNFSHPIVGDAAFIKEEQEPGRFIDGRAHDYALGLRIGRYRGVREVSHSGATAGYRAYLVNYPESQVSVAVLCNAGSANPTQSGHAVADIYLHLTSTAPSSTSVAATSVATDSQRLVGIYRNDGPREPLSIGRAGQDLQVDGGPTLTLQSGTRFTASGGRVFDFSGSGLTSTDEFGSVDRYVRVDAGDLAPKPLADYVASYTSDEAEVTMTAAVDGGTLVLKRRPDTVIRLTPVYADAFRGPIGFVRFLRDGSGRVTGFSINQDRVWDLRFARVD
jgi:CubicO group peptidase (beta-lactamase class C family)